MPAFRNGNQQLAFRNGNQLVGYRNGQLVLGPSETHVMSAAAGGGVTGYFDGTSIGSIAPTTIDGSFINQMYDFTDNVFRVGVGRGFYSQDSFDSIRITGPSVDILLFTADADSFSSQSLGSIWGWNGNLGLVAGNDYSVQWGWIKTIPTMGSQQIGQIFVGYNTPNEHNQTPGGSIDTIDSPASNLQLLGVYDLPGQNEHQIILTDNGAAPPDAVWGILRIDGPGVAVNLNRADAAGFDQGTNSTLWFYTGSELGFQDGGVYRVSLNA